MLSKHSRLWRAYSVHLREYTDYEKSIIMLVFQAFDLFFAFTFTQIFYWCHKFDSKKLALIALKPDLKVSVMPSDFVLNIRNLVRKYYRLKDQM